MNKTLENLRKIKELRQEGIKNILRIIFNIWELILFVLILPAFTGLGFFYFTSINSGSPSYFGSFLIAVGFSWVTSDHFWNNHGKPANKLINRNKKIREEIKQCQKIIH